jgi:serine/threonine-protein kinase
MAMKETETLWERPSEPPEMLVGDRYRILDHLGLGAVGIVYRAEDVVLRRTVALKVLSPANHDARALSRFHKEACALAQVRHANVVQIYSLGDHRGAPFIAMQYVEGQDLGAMIREHAARGATVPRERAIRILGEIASGLDAVHAHHLIHRDVKPSNIVIEKRSGRPILIDFGLARRLTASSPKLSVIGGTPWYMAPEQASDRDGLRISARSDLYSLACTAFELFTNRSVFEGDTGFAILFAHAQKPAPRISSVRRDLMCFDDAFACALAKAPEQRQRSCTAFVEELDEALRRADHRLPTPPPEAPTDGVRVLVLASRDQMRTQIAPTLARALRGFGTEIECVERAIDLARAFARSVADIIVIDDAVAGHRTEALVEGLRHAPGGRYAEVLLLGGDRSQARLDEIGARELPKPLNTHVLGVALGRMASRIAERRYCATSSTRPTTGFEPGAGA